MPTVVKQRSWPVAVVAGGLLAGLLFLGGWRSLSEGDGDGQADVDEQTDDSANTENDDAVEFGSLGCDPAEEAARLRGGVDAGSYEPAQSAYSLAANSPAAVRGRPVSASKTEGGTIIELDVGESRGTDRLSPSARRAIWTPATEPPAGPLAGEIVAFLTGDEVGTAASADGGHAAVVQLGGLWLGCDTRSPAEPVLVGTSGQPWPIRPSLDDLWRIYTAAAGPAPTILTPTVDGDVAIYDVRLDSGERLRLTVPTEAAEPVALLDEHPGGPTALIGDGLEIGLSIAPCTSRTVAADVHWALSSRMVEDGRLADDVVRVCRPDELVSMTVDSANLGPIIESGGAAALDHFDVWPIEVGSRHRAVLATSRPELAACPACAPWGPASHPDVGVAIVRSARHEVAAVGLDDLQVRWSFTAGRNEVALRPATGTVLLDVTPGELLALDPATGEQRWQLDRLVGERGEGVAEQPGRSGLAWSSFRAAGDHRPPLLRWLSLDTGVVRWEAEGRVGADWQGGAPVVIDDLVLAMDVLDPTVARFDPTAGGIDEAGRLDEAGGLLWAFGLDDGLVRWRVDVGNPPGARSQHVLGVVETPAGPAVIVRATDGSVFRVDPATGEELWRTRFDADRFEGTDQGPNGSVGLVVRTEFGTMLVDLDNGQVISR
ncbi:MAG: PQQ-binding-like beta-propeller repeat protein [Acidimicrobiales bacterium]